jgi:hypothetical protein
MVSKTRRFHKIRNVRLSTKSQLENQEIRQKQQKQNQKQNEKRQYKQKRRFQKSRKNIFKKLFPLTQIGRARLETYQLQPYSKCKTIQLDGKNEVHYVCPPENISLILAKFPAKILRKLLAIYPIHDLINETIIMTLAADDEELQKFYKELIDSKLAPLGEKAGEVVSRFLNSLWGGVPILGTIIAVKNAAETVSEAGEMVGELKGIADTDLFKIQLHIYKNMIALEAFTSGIMSVLGISAPEIIKAFQNSNVFAGLYIASKEGQFLSAVDSLKDNEKLLELAGNDPEKVDEVIKKIKEMYQKLDSQFPGSVVEKITGPSGPIRTELQPMSLRTNSSSFNEDPTVLR